MSQKRKIGVEEVLNIASLAKLDLKKEEVEKYSEQMSQFLEYVEQLNTLNTDDVEPLSHVLEITNVSRQDKVEPSLTKQDAIRNAPQSDGEFFIVPKVIQKSEDRSES